MQIVGRLTSIRTSGQLDADHEGVGADSKFFTVTTSLDPKTDVQDRQRIHKGHTKHESYR